MPELQAKGEPAMKNNVLPFPALYAVPKDPPRPSVWRGLVTLAVLAAALGLFALTLWALFM